MREIVLDTETTGFDPRGGDRMVEIACLELENLTPTGRTFHTLINPGRTIGPEVVRVHGITNEKVKDAPRFAEIADDLLAFIADSPVVAHNAGFDRNFVNFELEEAGRPTLADEQWIDTLPLAQKRFPGMANSLDALCKRFKVSLVERTLHGALIDTRLLASVYLELKGGRERALDLSGPSAEHPRIEAGQSAYGERPRPLGPRSTPTERSRHADFLRATLTDTSLWARLVPDLAD
ncbi:MAG: DNA polymerase III subunit epsilon [Caulobacterales bacterium]|nr:DNA polymerase III subunit epsilon [Caulobacterales bacterium]